MTSDEMPDYKQWIRQVKLARFERLSLAAGLEAERQGLTEEELEVEEEVPDPSPKEVERTLHLVRDPKDVAIALAAISVGLDYFVTNDKDLTAQDETTAALRQKIQPMIVGQFLSEIMGRESEDLERIRKRN